MGVKLTALKDGRQVPLPEGVENIVIQTDIGGIYIQLEERVPNMVLMRAAATERGVGVNRLIFSPMDSGRVAVGVIKTEG